MAEASLSCLYTDLDDGIKKYVWLGDQHASKNSTCLAVRPPASPCPVFHLHMHRCRLLELPGPHYVLFMADPDPATGVSWCPDCVRCGPAVKNVMADKKASLLEVLVGQRPVWKDPQHPLR